MAPGKFGYRLGILLVIFVVLVVVVIYGGLKLSGDSITGTVGLGENAITGLSTYECEYVVGGIRCGADVYVQIEDICPNETVPVCTNICELDRLTIGDDRVCPSYCTEHCLPPTVAENLKG